MTGQRIRYLDVPALWAGVIAISTGAGLLAVFGVLAARVLGGVDILGPSGGTAFAATDVYWFTISAVLAALVAGALVHVLLYLTAQPLLLFGWIACLTTALLVIWPFTTAAPMLAKAATAAVNFAIGTAIACLTMTVAGHAKRDT
jgi:hypothetical protein